MPMVFSLTFTLPTFVFSFSLIFVDNTKRRAGVPCCQMKNMNFLRAGELHRRAGCTTGWASWLHSKLGYRKGGPESYPFLQPAPPFFAARRLALLSFVQPASPTKGYIFHLETRPSSPPISATHFFQASMLPLRVSVRWALG